MTEYVLLGYEMVIIVIAVIIFSASHSTQQDEKMGFSVKYVYDNRFRRTMQNKCVLCECFFYMLREDAKSLQ